MSEYTIDGPAFYRDGKPMSDKEILNALRAGDREATGFRAMCEAFERLEEIVGLNTGGGMGPGPALNAVEQIIREREAVAAHAADEAREHFLYGYGFCRANGFLFDDQLQAAADEYVRRLRQAQGKEATP